MTLLNGDVDSSCGFRNTGSGTVIVPEHSLGAETAVLNQAEFKVTGAIEIDAIDCDPTLVV